MPNLPFNYADFHGGLNTYNAYDLLEDNEARDLSNVQGTTAGAIVKRNGFQRLWTPPHVINSIYCPVQGSQVVAADNVTGDLLTFDGAVTTTLKTGLTAGRQWEFIRAPAISGQGPTFMMNGTDTPQQWNDAGLSPTNPWTATDVGGSVPNGRWVIYHNNQAFVAGDANHPYRLAWSGLGDVTAWNPANLNGSGFMDFDPNDSFALTGIGISGPYILVFKQNKTWVVVDAATATVRQLSNQVGCQAHRSIASSPEGTYFMAADNQAYVTNGSKLTRISDKIRPTIAALTPLSAIYYDSHYYLSGTIRGGGYMTLDYDARLGSWWKHTVGIYDWAHTFQSSGEQVPFAAHADSTFVSSAFSSAVVHQDNGSNFTWSWSGPWLSPSFYRRRRFPTPYFRKRLRQTRYDGLGQVDFSICKDFNVTPTLIASDIFANATVTTEARSFGQGVSNTFSAVFSGTYDAPAQLNQYTLFINDRRDLMPA